MKRCTFIYNNKYYLTILDNESLENVLNKSQIDINEISGLEIKEMSKLEQLEQLEKETRMETFQRLSIDEQNKHYIRIEKLMDELQEEMHGKKNN